MQYNPCKDIQFDRGNHIMPQANAWLKWCPKGCGKCVALSEKGNKHKPSIYICNRCGKKFTAKQLKVKKRKR